MSIHLTLETLSALADGELSTQQLVHANEHLAACSACMAQALELSLLKSATARAGHRYVPPPHLQQRLAGLAAQQNGPLSDAASPERLAPSVHSTRWFGALGWAMAALVLLVVAGTMIEQRSSRGTNIALAQNAALVTEVFDQHVATLAAGLPPQVLSTDRHTVKPWFQGKIPFSFNLPETLPQGTTLDGGNLTYLDNQPVAQLLYSIGRHRVSIFVMEKSSATTSTAGFDAEHEGFHVVAFAAGAQEMVAISDADPGHLAALVDALRRAQGKAATHKLP